MSGSISRRPMARQREIQKHLPHRGPVTTYRELTRKLHDADYDVTEHPVERVLKTLADIFPLFCSDNRSQFGWYWMRGSADSPRMTLAEALTLQLVEGSIRPLVPASMLTAIESRFGQSRNKLQSIEE